MKTIVCYGDSNTYGYNPENGFRYEYEERWTTILQKELKDSAIVIPEGLNGRTTSFEDELRPGRNGATYLDPCLHSHGPIDLVVLMLGTNDLKIRFQATPTDIGKGIDRLIKMIKSITPQKRQDGQSAKILLMAPPHLGDDLTEIPSGEEMGFERGISYSKRLAPIYEDWAKFHNIEFLDAAKYAKEVGATVIALVGEKECPLAEYADYVFENRTASNDNLVEEIYIQYFALGARFMKNNGEFPEYEKFIDALKQMPEVLQKVREDNDERALAFAEKHKDTKFHMCVGAGNTWGETYCFAMCVLEEMQWIATKSIHAAEFFHGTVEMTEKDMSFMLFKGEDETRPLLDRVEKFVRKYSDVVQVWDTKDYELKGVDPSVRGLVSPLVMAAQLERVSAHFEHVRNHSLEIRRYYRCLDY